MIIHLECFLLRPLWQWASHTARAFRSKLCVKPAANYAKNYSNSISADSLMADTPSSSLNYRRFERAPSRNDCHVSLISVSHSVVRSASVQRCQFSHQGAMGKYIPSNWNACHSTILNCWRACVCVWVGAPDENRMEYRIKFSRQFQRWAKANRFPHLHTRFKWRLRFDVTAKNEITIREAVWQWQSFHS